MRIKLATPTLFTQQPESKRQSMRHSSGLIERLPAGKKLGIRLDGQNVHALRGLDLIATFNSPTPNLRRRFNRRTVKRAARCKQSISWPASWSHLMLTQLPSSQESLRNLSSRTSPWHDGDSTRLHLAAQAAGPGGLWRLQTCEFTIRLPRLLLPEPRDCDVVCRNKPEQFAQRVREVGGFLFDNVPRNAILPRRICPL